MNQGTAFTEKDKILSQLKVWKINFSYLFQLAVLFLLYFINAQIGLKIDSINTFAARYWPPTAIALAAALLFGMKIWPGIWLAAFSANLWSRAPLFAAFGIALGNTAEALVGTYLLTQVFDFKRSFRRIRDVFQFFGITLFVSCPLSASIGILSLSLTGGVAAGSFFHSWLTWWIGDSLGAEIFTPLILLIVKKSRVLLYSSTSPRNTRAPKPRFHHFLFNI